MSAEVYRDPSNHAAKHDIPRFLSSTQTRANLGETDTSDGVYGCQTRAATPPRGPRAGHANGTDRLRWTSGSPLLARLTFALRGAAPRIEQRMVEQVGAVVRRNGHRCRFAAAAVRHDARARGVERCFHRRHISQRDERGAARSVQDEMPVGHDRRAAAVQQRGVIHVRHERFTRAEQLRSAAQILRDNAPEYARLMTHEMGKPISDGRAEVEKCAWVCEYFADHAASFLEDEEIASDASKSFVTFQPIGVVLAVMPWNFPFWQVFRFAAPGIMAGNAALLKHAPNVPGCALAIEDVFREAGFPEKLFNTLLLPTDQVEKVIKHPSVRAVTLTGSTGAGRAVAKQAGECLKKTVLELGGSDPYLILKDANLDDAVPTCVQSRLINNGQSCISAKRFIVPKSLLGEFQERYVSAMREFDFGNPMDPQMKLGTIARRDLRDNLHDQVEESIKKGADCLLGGELPNRKGYFYPPTVLTNVSPGMPAYDEELFGPVASIIPVEDEQEGIEVANDSNYGLGAAIFSSDLERAEKIAAEKLEAGCCFVNSFVKSDPRLPFGGIKDSGYGRELSYYGIKEFVNVKTVYVK